MASNISPFVAAERRLLFAQDSVRQPLDASQDGPSVDRRSGGPEARPSNKQLGVVTAPSGIAPFVASDRSVRSDALCS